MDATNASVSSTPAIDVQEKTIQELTAETVNITNGGAGVVKGRQVALTLKNGGVGAVMAQKVEATVQDGGIGAVMAQDVTAGGTTIMFALAGNISGATKIMVDMRAGLVAGLAIGVVLAALRLLTRARR